MPYFNRLLNKLKNSYRYKIHTAEVNRFVTDTYPTLTAKSILGPLFDSGFWSEENYMENLTKLESWIESNNLENSRTSSMGSL